MTNAGKWRHWCSLFEGVEGELFRTHYYRWMWRALNVIIDEAGIRKNPVFMGYLGETYVAYIAMFVRREADLRRDSSSLAKCIQYLENNPDALSRSDYLKLAEQELASKVPDVGAGFDKFSEDGDSLDSTLLKQRREALSSSAGRVKSYADQYLAHRAALPTGQLPTFGDIDSAMAEIEDVAKDFYSLRYPGTSLWTATPVPDLSFLKMFSQPWFPTGSTLPKGLE